MSKPSDPLVTIHLDGDTVEVAWTVGELADLDLAETSSYREPEWPLPDGIDGRVWIQDARFDVTTRIDGLFELLNMDLLPVPRWDGVAVLAYWQGYVGDGACYSPSLVFTSLVGAVGWARSVADDITVRLTTTTNGLWRERPGAQRLPGDVLAAWDAVNVT